MKKLFLVVLIGHFSFFCYAQSASEKASKECCACIKKHQAKHLEAKELQDAVTECLTLGLTENIVGLCKEYGYKLDDMNEENGRQIGERFTLKLMANCPEASEALMALGMQEVKKDGNAMKNFVKQTGTTTGSITAVEETGPITKIKCTTTDGKTMTFYWMQNFPGDKMLIQKKYAGKKLNIAYGEQEYYDSTKASYQKMLVILELGLAD